MPIILVRNLLKHIYQLLSCIIKNVFSYSFEKVNDRVCGMRQAAMTTITYMSFSSHFVEIGVSIMQQQFGVHVFRNIMKPTSIAKHTRKFCFMRFYYKKKLEKRRNPFNIRGDKKINIVWYFFNQKVIFCQHLIKAL